MLAAKTQLMPCDLIQLDAKYYDRNFAADSSWQAPPAAHSLGPVPQAEAPLQVAHAAVCTVVGGPRSWDKAGHH